MGNRFDYILTDEEKKSLEGNRFAYAVGMDTGKKTTTTKTQPKARFSPKKLSEVREETALWFNKYPNGTREQYLNSVKGLTGWSPEAAGEVYDTLQGGSWKNYLPKTIRKSRLVPKSANLNKRTISAGKQMTEKDIDETVKYAERKRDEANQNYDFKAAQSYQDYIDKTAPQLYSSLPATISKTRPIHAGERVSRFMQRNFEAGAKTAEGVISPVTRTIASVAPGHTIQGKPRLSQKPVYGENEKGEIVPTGMADVEEPGMMTPYKDPAEFVENMIQLAPPFLMAGGIKTFAESAPKIGETGDIVTPLAGLGIALGVAGHMARGVMRPRVEMDSQARVVHDALRQINENGQGTPATLELQRQMEARPVDTAPSVAPTEGRNVAEPTQPTNHTGFEPTPSESAPDANSGHGKRTPWRTQAKLRESGFTNEEIAAIHPDVQERLANERIDSKAVTIHDDGSVTVKGKKGGQRTIKPQQMEVEVAATPPKREPVLFEVGAEYDTPAGKRVRVTDVDADTGDISFIEAGGDGTEYAAPGNTLQEWKPVVRQRTEANVSDSENVSGLPGGEPQREATLETQPVEAGSGGEIEAGGNVQENAVRGTAEEKLGIESLGPETTMPTMDIAEDPARFQYKESNPPGETPYNPKWADTIDVWRDPADGKTYVVNGHKRLAWAKRDGAPTMRVRYINVKTASQARIFGALKNISQNSGTAIDAAKVFRESGATPEMLAEEGISVRGAVARDGIALAKLPDDLFNAVIVGKLQQQRAIQIATMLDDPADMRALAQSITELEKGGDHIRDDEIPELVRAVENAPKSEAVQETIFGTETIRKNLVREKAQLSAWVKRELRSDHASFKSAAKNAERLKKGNNIIDAEASQAIADTAEQVGEIYDKLNRYQGPISEALNDATKRIAEGESADAVRQRLYARVHEEVRKAITGGREGSGPGIQEARNGGTGATGSIRTDEGQPAGLQQELTPETATQVEAVRQILQKAEKKQPELDSIGNEIASSVNGRYFGHVKSEKSLLDKVTRKQQSGIDYDPTSAKDHARGTIVVTSWEDAPGVIKRLQEKGFSVESTINEPLNKFGYRGINSNRALGDGVNGEIQVHRQDSWDLKLQTDEIYREWRDKTDEDINSLSVDELHRYRADVDNSRKLWDDYWAKIPEDSRAAISSSLKGFDSVTAPTVNPSGLTQELPSQTNAPSSRSQQRRPSASLETEGSDLENVGDIVVESPPREVIRTNDTTSEGDVNPNIEGARRKVPEEQGESLFDVTPNNAPKRDISENYNQQHDLVLEVQGKAPEEPQAAGTLFEAPVETNRVADLEKKIDDLQRRYNSEKKRLTTPGKEAAKILKAQLDAAKGELDNLLNDLMRGGSKRTPPGVEGSVTLNRPRTSAATSTPEPQAGKPVAERDIVKLLVDSTGQPHRQGRMRPVGRMISAIFKRQEQVSRARNMYDVADATHEIGHGLDEKYGWSAGDTSDLGGLRYSEELSKFGDPERLGEKSSWEPEMGPERLQREGVAEYTRLYIENPEMASREAPTFTTEFERVLKENNMLDAFRQAQDMWKRVVNQTGDQKLRAQTDYAGEVDQKKPGWHGFRTDVIDDLYPVRNIVETVTNKRYENTPPSQNPYILMRNSRGSSEIAHQLLTEGNARTKGMAEILRMSGDKSKDHMDFQDYARARRLAAYDDAGRATGAMTRKEIDEVIAKYDRPEFRQAFNELQRWVDELLQIEGNFYTPEAARAWKQIPDYIPMKRVIESGIGEGTEAAKYGPNRKFGNQQIGYYRYEGTSHAQYQPWLETLIDRAYSSAQKAMQNDGMLALVDMVNSYKGGGKILEHVPADLIPHSALGELKVALEQAGKKIESIEGAQELIDMIDSLPDEMFDLKYWETVNRLTNGQKADRILMVMRKGKPEFYQVKDPVLYDSLVGLGPKERNIVLQIAGIPANTIRAGVTLDPGFLFYSNLVRDSLHAYMVTEGGFVPFWDTVKGMKEAAVGGEARSQWIEAGGAMSGTAALDRADVRMKARRLSNQASMPGLNDIKDGIRRLRDASEMTNRIAVFKRELSAIKKKHPEWSEQDHAIYAAFRSRDMMDFAMKGRLSAEATGLISFARAKINGLAKMGHEAVKNPARVLIHGAPLVAATAILYELNRNNSDYWKLTEWERNNYWHVPIPGNSREFARIPKPHEWGFVFGTSVEDGLRKLQDSDPHAFDSAMGAVYNVVGMDVPNIVQLAIDLSSNRQSFSGAPIVPDYLAEGSSAVRPEDQANKSTSPTYRRIGRLVRASPSKLEYAAKQLGGPSADYATSLIDWMLSPLYREKPQKSINPMRRMTTHLNTYPAMYDTLVDHREKLDKDYNSMKQLDKPEDMDKKAKAMGYPSRIKLQQKRQTVTSAVARISALRKRFFEAKTDKEKYAIRDQIQEVATEALNRAGYRFSVQGRLIKKEPEKSEE